MLTTKRNELEVINSFNDLMKDTKQKQRINKLVKQYSNEYFMGKLNDSDIVDTLQELSTHYQKYAYVIVRRIKANIIDEYCTDEEYYDGSIDNTGRQIAKKRRVIDTKKVGKNFEEDLEEELTSLVVEDYFKNLDKALEVYKFNLKVEKMKAQKEIDKLQTRYNEIDSYIIEEIKETYNYYINKGEEKEDILYNFKYNTDVINSMFTRIAMKFDNKLGIKINKQNIETKLNKELKLFIKLKENEEDTDEEKSKIPSGWKAFAITKFINKMFK